MKCKIILIFTILAACNILEIDTKREEINNVEVIIMQKTPLAFTIKKKLDPYFNSSDKKEKLYELTLFPSSIVEQKNSGSDAFSSGFKVTVSVKFSLNRKIDGVNLFTGSASDNSFYISSRSKLLSEYMYEKQITEKVAEKVAEAVYEKIYSALHATSKPLI